MSTRHRVPTTLAVTFGAIACCGGCCGNSSAQTRSTPNCPTSSRRLEEEPAGIPPREVASNSCIQLEAERLPESECRHLCLVLTVRASGCERAIWFNSTMDVAIPDKIDGAISLDVREADTGTPAHTLCLVRPSPSRPMPEYIQLRDSTVLRRRISEACYQTDSGKAWRVIVRYKDNRSGPPPSDAMQDWFTGELVSNEVLIPVKGALHATP